MAVYISQKMSWMKNDCAKWSYYTTILQGKGEGGGGGGELNVFKREGSNQRSPNPYPSLPFMTKM